MFVGNSVFQNIGLEFKLSGLHLAERDGVGDGGDQAVISVQFQEIRYLLYAGNRILQYLFIPLIGVLPRTEEHLTYNGGQHNGGRNPCKTHGNPQVSARPSHLRSERKPRWVRLKTHRQYWWETAGSDNPLSHGAPRSSIKTVLPCNVLLLFVFFYYCVKCDH